MNVWQWIIAAAGVGLCIMLLGMAIITLLNVKDCERLNDTTELLPASKEKLGGAVCLFVLIPIVAVICSGLSKCAG